MLDLHIHTNASSDGIHTPEEIFSMVAKISNIPPVVIAFADHNSTDSVNEGIRLSRDSKIPFISGVEMDSSLKGEDVHILGYFIDHKAPPLIDFLKALRRELIGQTDEKVKLLNEIGFVLTTEDVLSESGGKPPTGRSFLMALTKGKENSDDERLNRYIDGDRSDSPSLNFYLDFLSGGKPAHVPVETATTKVVIEIIHEAQGLAFLAHPVEYTPDVIDEVIDMGIDGIEAYSGHHDEKTDKFFDEFARKRGLLISAGSDFHGKKIKPEIELGVHINCDTEIYTKMAKNHRDRYA